MKLQKHVLYHVSIENVSFGAIPEARLLEAISSGRVCGVLIESDIANRFDGVTEGKQGSGADFFDERLGSVQAKTFRSDQCNGLIKQGKNKGLNRKDIKNIFTTKSGLWDSMKRRKALGEDVEKQITDYFNKYDMFCYIDISKMTELKYSFVVVSSEVPIKNHKDGFISMNDIMSNVEKEVTING